MRAVARRCPTASSVLDEGEVIAAGAPREAMRDPEVIRVYLGKADAA